MLCTIGFSLYKIFSGLLAYRIHQGKTNSPLTTLSRVHNLIRGSCPFRFVCNMSTVQLRGGAVRCVVREGWEYTIADEMYNLEEKMIRKRTYCWECSSCRSSGQDHWQRCNYEHPPIVDNSAPQPLLQELPNSPRHHNIMYLTIKLLRVALRNLEYPSCPFSHPLNEDTTGRLRDVKREYNVGANAHSCKWMAVERVNTLNVNYLKYL